MRRQLGAFGFLSSDEIYRYGITNAGLRDQLFALQWVQSYIGLFGGNASAVTISGLSAGGTIIYIFPQFPFCAKVELGGSVMLQSMAFGGDLGTSLFRQVSALRTVPCFRQQSCIRKLMQWAGHRGLSVPSAAMEVWRLCSFTVLLRLRSSCWLLSWIATK